MNKTDHEERMQRVLDGVATAAEEAQLQAALEGSPELRSRYDELKRVFGLLESVSDVDPPPEAAREVILDFRARRAQQGRNLRQASQGGWMAAAVESLRRRLSPQLAYAFVTGAVAGVALLLGVGGNPRSGMELGAPGTLRSFQGAAQAEVVDTAQLEAPGFSGEVRTFGGAGPLLLEIDCESTTAATIHVAWGEASPRLLGFEQMRPQAQLLADDGGLRIDHSGDNAYRLWLARPESEAPLHVEVLVGGRRLERDLRTLSVGE
jgi:hypothetical protein